MQAKRFIFISSLIVYENKTNKKENEKLNISNKNSLYCNSKILCESFYQKKNALILRLGTLIGKDMRKNNVNKVIKDKKPRFPIKSFYTFVDYSVLSHKFIFKKKLMEFIISTEMTLLN